MSYPTITERLAAKAIDATPVVKAHETCRAPYNHDWVEYESTTNPQGGGWYLTMRCSKCTTIFKQIINPDGSIYGGRNYTHPKDYKDSDKWSRSEWRRRYLEKLRR